MEKIELFLQNPHKYFYEGFEADMSVQGLDRTRVEKRTNALLTTSNYTTELSTFGIIAGVKPAEVQWSGLGAHLIISLQHGLQQQAVMFLFLYNTGAIEIGSRRSSFFLKSKK